MINKERLLERFLKYVKVDTGSDPNSGTYPSTLKQFDLAYILRDELISLGLDAYTDDKAYTYALLKSNTKKDVSPIGFIAHIDTSFDAPSDNVNPRVIKNYDGSDIKLNENMIMSRNDFPSLNLVIGDDIVVTDGNTLLGADDKLGVVEIIEVINVLVDNKNIEHGHIYICFTPDEEIGEGANFFDLNFFKADFAYTLDGSAVGCIEYENFNAASALVDITGVSIHPGDAKDKLINALNLAMEFNSLLPVEQNPRYTKDYEGFNHLTSLNGSVENAKAHYIIRNHDMNLFNEQKKDFVNAANFLNEKYKNKLVKVTITDSYFNMYEIIKDRMDIIDLAKTAITNVGLTPQTLPIRGGTDGARLSYMGLPCPNLGTGGFNYHGRYEFASIDQAVKASKIVLEIIKLHTNK